MTIIPHHGPELVAARLSYTLDGDNPSYLTDPSVAVGPVVAWAAEDLDDPDDGETAMLRPVVAETGMPVAVPWHSSQETVDGQVYVQWVLLGPRANPLLAELEHDWRLAKVDEEGRAAVRETIADARAKAAL